MANCMAMAAGKCLLALHFVSRKLFMRETRTFENRSVTRDLSPIGPSFFFGAFLDKILSLVVMPASKEMHSTVMLTSLTSVARLV
jgi:hypothetical protein